jgi:hypothetical protein
MRHVTHCNRNVGSAQPSIVLKARVTRPIDRAVIADLLDG